MVGSWHLLTGNSFHAVSKTFAIRKSIAVTITHEIWTEISRLSPQFIKFSNLQLEATEAIINFKQDCDCKILQALGVVACTHMFIQTPENELNFVCYCHKQRCSIQNSWWNLEKLSMYVFFLLKFLVNASYFKFLFLSKYRKYPYYNNSLQNPIFFF